MPSELALSKPVSSAKSDDVVELTEHQLVVNNLPDSCHGWVVAHLSDFHAGCGNWEQWIGEAVEHVGQLNPDLVLLTGDFVDNHAHEVPLAVAALADIKAKHGVFASIGNHDHRGDVPALVNGLESNGIEVLLNCNRELPCGLTVAGVDDCEEGNPDLPATLRGVGQDAPQLLLSHHPNMFHRLETDRDVVVFAGHTHGGQIKLGSWGPSLVCRMHLSTRYVHGWYRHGQARMYVNRGLGVTGTKPLNRRYKCPRELSVYRLRGGAEVDGSTL